MAETQVRPPPPQTEEQEPEYAIERIIFHGDFQISGKEKGETVRLYCVKWEGYSMNDERNGGGCTWEIAGNIPDVTLKEYELLHGDNITNFHREIRLYEMEDYDDKPPLPVFVPKRCVYSKNRMNYAKRIHETMYLMEYKFIKFKVWESRETPGIQDLIREYQKKQPMYTGTKRKRSGYEEDSDNEEAADGEYVDEGNVYDLDENIADFCVPTAKIQKLNDGTRKKKRKRRRGKTIEKRKKQKKTIRRKKKKKKKQVDDDIYADYEEEETFWNQMVVDSSRKISFIGEQELENGETKTVRRSLKALKKKEKDVCVSMLKEAIFAIMDDSGNNEITVQFHDNY